MVSIAFFALPIICRPEHRAAAAWGLGVEAVPDREVEEGSVGGELWVSSRIIRIKY